MVGGQTVDWGGESGGRVWETEAVVEIRKIPGKLDCARATGKVS